MKASCLGEEGRAVLKALGADFDASWEEHRYLYRRWDDRCLVMGHFFRMEDGWADVEECWCRVKQACVPSLSCSRHDANGFFFYLGVGDFRVLLRWMIKEERMKYFIGFRAGNVYLYGRKEVELLIKLLGKGKNHGRQSV